MNALSRIYAVLRPRGLLLNLLPEVTHRAVEVGIGGVILRLGYLDDTRDIHDFRVMLAAQQAVIDNRLFALERETRFTFVEHFDVVESWLTYMAEHESGVTIPIELVGRAGELLPPGTAGEVRISREFYAARLRAINRPPRSER